MLLVSIKEFWGYVLDAVPLDESLGNLVNAGAVIFVDDRWFIDELSADVLLNVVD